MKISITKSSKGSNVYIIKSFRSRGKSTSCIVEKLGKLEDLDKRYGDGMAYVKERRRQLEKIDVHFDSNKRIHFSISEGEAEDLRNYRFGGHLPLRKIYRKLNIHEFVRNIQDKSKITFSLDAALETMVCSRILDPMSKFGTSEYAKKLVDNPELELQHYYRAMDVLYENIDKIQAHCYKNLTNVVNKNKSVWYYDCTNFFFETESTREGSLRQYGMSKEHRPNPIVQMGLFTDANGIPLAFAINPGNTNEQITLKPLQEKIIKDFGVEKMIVSTDAGLSSYNNRAFNDRQGRAFVSTQSIKKLKGHLKDWVFIEKDWKKLNSSKKEDGFKPSMIDDLEDGTILYKSRFMLEGMVVEDAYGNKIKMKQSWKLIVTFSKDYAKYQKKIRDEQFERAKKLIKDPSRYNKVNSNDCRRFVKGISYTEQGEIAKHNKLSIDEDIYKEESKYDGYYGLTTNIEDNTEEVIAINHNRWKIEQCFRIMKTEFSARPVFHYKNERIETHFLICFLALLIFRLLEKKLNGKYTVSQILNALKEMNFLELKEGFIPTYEPNAVTKDIAEVFDYGYINRGCYTHESMQHLINLSKRY
ncbi:MAG TPA: IS1634 family transposase [Bacilli bacterium]|jgi:transposase|nr:IS1634 family transposase [Bacilli bacterium]